MKTLKTLFTALAALLLASCDSGGVPPSYDVIISGGTIYDGGGGAPYAGDVAIAGDRIAAVGDLGAATAARVVDATGLAVAPGFINMLSWAVTSLIEDGRGMSDIKQGVTLEVFGEGRSWGPLNEAMKAEEVARQSDIKYDIEWTTLGQYLDYMEARGISPNIASFVGATSVRIHELGHEDRPPTAAELARMQELVREAMREGALGVGSSLIYPPAFFAQTDELIALLKAAGEYGGMYISHMRNEGKTLLEAIDELITIARQAGVPAEIYHLKQAGPDNWHKLALVIEKVEAARAEGLAISADMYTYTAGATGLSAIFPPWTQEGGHQAFMARLADPEVRARIIGEINDPEAAWDNSLSRSGPEKTLLIGFKNPELKPLTGKTLAEVAEMRGGDPIEVAMDLILEDDSRVDTVYFMMAEENVGLQTAIPWLSFGSDAGALATEGKFLLKSTHPRAYGNFARLLGKYVREEGRLSLEEAVRKLTSQPAANLKLRDRGALRAGYYADLAIFDAATIIDHATFAEPHQYATGMVHVFVNGGQVLEDGEHTGATPGRVVRGPGWTGWQEN